jgi:hypothetical protein
MHSVKMVAVIGRLLQNAMTLADGVGFDARLSYYIKFFSAQAAPVAIDWAYPACLFRFDLETDGDIMVGAISWRWQA